MVRLVNKEEVINLFDELLPWDKDEVREAIGTGFKSQSQEEILNHFGIDPIDFVTARECAEAFGDDILDQFADYEIIEELDRRVGSFDPSDLIDTLKRKLDTPTEKMWFTEKDADDLQMIVRRIKKALYNNKSK